MTSNNRSQRSSAELVSVAIRHYELPRYGVLFHPEVRNEQVVRNFLAL